MLQYRLRPERSEEESIETYWGHAAERGAAVQRRVAQSSTGPMMLRDVDLRPDAGDVGPTPESPWRQRPPHTHDENTDEFQPLPDQLIQVEAGLEVSLRPAAEIATLAGGFLVVTCVWRDGMSIPVSVCEMAQDEGALDDEEPPVKHKMPTRCCCRSGIEQLGVRTRSWTTWSPR